VSWSRAGALTTYREVARRVGLDPNHMLIQAGIDPEILGNPEVRIGSQAVGKLLEESAVAAGCPAFGALMAEARTLSALGPLTLLLSHQRTLRDALHAFVRYDHLLNGALLLAIEEHDEVALLRMQIDTPFAFPRRQSIELAVTIFARALVQLGGDAWRPESVHFLHRAPHDLSIHSRILGTTLAFESDFSGLAFSRAALDSVNPNADPRIGSYARDYLDSLRPEGAPESVEEQVRGILYGLLPRGLGTIDQVAAQLSCSPRTLQRLLDREDLTFSDVLSDVRRTAVVRYLNIPGKSMSAIAAMLGYASLSSFTRWFATEFGMAPSNWRSAYATRDTERPAVARPMRLSH
jgi:AraC-like DNA-binding protein